MQNTLLEAEKNQEWVHILAHLPAGSTECQFTWSRQYSKIINRFAHIITGQFNGHTHNDEFNVFYDLDDQTKPINVAWNGGSITAWAQLNPNYKIYKANANTYVILFFFFLSFFFLLTRWLNCYFIINIIFLIFCYFNFLFRL